MSLLVDTRMHQQLQYIYPHPEYPHAVAHALFSAADTQVKAHLSVAGGVVADGSAFVLGDGCEEGSLSNYSTMNKSIAMIVRGGCSFATKAENVAAAGAVGMIVVDTCRTDSVDTCNTEVAPIMSLGSAAVSAAVYNLVAVAVTEDVGVQMLQLNMQDSTITVTIEKNTPAGIADIDSEHSMYDADDDYYGGEKKTMFGHFVLFSGCITMAMLGLMSFLQYRQNRHRAARRVELLHGALRQQELDAQAVFMMVPVTKYELDPEVPIEDRDVCCICLDHFEDGDDIRKLPCKHMLHKDCIDPWLESHVTCPLCKDDVYVAVGIHDPPPGTEQAAEPDHVVVDLAETIVDALGGSRAGNDHGDDDDGDDDDNDDGDEDEHAAASGMESDEEDSARGFEGVDQNSTGSNNSLANTGDDWAEEPASSQWRASTPVTRGSGSSFELGSTDSLERIPVTRSSHALIMVADDPNADVAGGGAADADEYIEVGGAVPGQVDNSIPSAAAERASIARTLL